MKLAIVTTHPIQYNAPLFKMLSERKILEIKVFYTWSQATAAVFDPGFGKKRSWDIPLLDGYDYSFVPNTATKPGSHHFFGIKNPDLFKEINSWRPKAILIFGWSFHSHLQCLRYYKGRIPVFFRGDSTLIDEVPSLKTALRRTLLKWVYRHVDFAFYVGQNNKAYFLKHGVSAKQLYYAPHAIDNDRFGNSGYKMQADEKRISLGFSATDFVVLFAGKLEPKKNPFFLLELAELIKKPEVKFLIVGNGSLEKQIKEQAKNDSRIVFLEFQNQSAMPVIYHLSDVFILPSNGPGETWGLAANEAMACGKPVVLSEKVGGAPDLVVEGNNGITFKLNESKKVAAYLSLLINDRLRYSESAANSVTLIQNFSFTRVAEAFETAIAAHTIL